MLVQFQARKQKILQQLNVPVEEYHDLSPKGSIDAPIRDLIGEINSTHGLVTTSSCSGRISVFLEGRRADTLGAQSSDGAPAGPGGKGGGGSWLFISHDPVEMPLGHHVSYFTSAFGLKKYEPGRNMPRISCRHIHLKFEPMILHILSASLDQCQHVLAAALNAGFRESGAVSLNPSKNGEINPVVAVRSTGYSFDAIIGFQSDEGDNVALVDENYLQTLVAVANERFKTNDERIARFQSALRERYNTQVTHNSGARVLDWEDTQTRRRRKREEGLARQQALKSQKETSNTTIVLNSDGLSESSVAFIDSYEVNGQ